VLRKLFQSIAFVSWYRISFFVEDAFRDFGPEFLFFQIGARSEWSTYWPADDLMLIKDFSPFDLI